MRSYTVKMGKRTHISKYILLRIATSNRIVKENKYGNNNLIAYQHVQIYIHVYNLINFVSHNKCFHSNNKNIHVTNKVQG